MSSSTSVEGRGTRSPDAGHTPAASRVLTGLRIRSSAAGRPQTSSSLVVTARNPRRRDDADVDGAD